MISADLFKILRRAVNGFPIIDKNSMKNQAWVGFQQLECSFRLRFIYRQVASHRRRLLGLGTPKHSLLQKLLKPSHRRQPQRRSIIVPSRVPQPRNIQILSLPNQKLSHRVCVPLAPVIRMNPQPLHPTRPSALQQTKVSNSHDPIILLNAVEMAVFVVQP